jgi:heme oxygenase (mycobilin-producing)
VKGRAGLTRLAGTDRRRARLLAALCAQIRATHPCATFAARAGAVDNQDGFELLKPTDERTTWLVVTRWRDEASFQAWLHSPAFGHGHRSAAERGSGPPPGPVGVSSELWSYEIAGGSAR